MRDWGEKKACSYAKTTIKRDEPRVSLTVNLQREMVLCFPSDNRERMVGPELGSRRGND